MQSWEQARWVKLELEQELRFYHDRIRYDMIKATEEKWALALALCSQEEGLEECCRGLCPETKPCQDKGLVLCFGEEEDEASIRILSYVPSCGVQPFQEELKLCGLGNFIKTYLTMLSSQRRSQNHFFFNFKYLSYFSDYNMTQKTLSWNQKVLDQCMSKSKRK